MTQTTAEQIRRWTGPAILSFGFRPFFFLGALWAALAMVMWIFMLAGELSLPTRFDAVSWHSHEFLFGYLSAVIAGFLLTAVPNWTGRLPIVGWHLGGLAALWIAGRFAIAISEFIPPLLVALIDLAFPVALGLLIAREIVAGKNWRNLIVLAMLTVFTLANLLFHLEAEQGAYAAQGVGLRLGLAAALMMISVIGGRIVPSFTRSWLVKTGSSSLPVSPMQRFDKLVLLITLTGLVLWVIWPNWYITGLVLLLLATVQTVRLARWKGLNTLSEPLVWVLHIGYALVPLGAMLVGVEILFPEALGVAAPQHVWMAGATGLMTLAVMTRATLGHTGRDLHAGLATLAIYLALVASVSVRLAAGVFPEIAMTLYSLSALLWIGAFGGFVIAYGGLLLRPKPGMSS